MHIRTNESTSEINARIFVDSQISSSFFNHHNGTSISKPFFPAIHSLSACLIIYFSDTLVESVELLLKLQHWLEFVEWKLPYRHVADELFVDECHRLSLFSEFFIHQ